MSTRRSRRRLCTWVAITSLAAFVPRAALGAEERSAAREIFDAAQRLFAGKNYRAAALAFESAADKEPHAGAYHAAGVSWQEAGEPARAADNLARASSLATVEGELKADARRRLAVLRTQLGRIYVDAPRGTRVSVAHVQNVAPPVDLHATPGEHGVNVTWPSGYASSHTLRVAPGKRIELQLTSADEPKGWESEPERRADDDSQSSQLRTVGLIGIGSGVALGVVGSVLLANGISARDEFRDSGRKDVDAHDRAVSLRTWGNVMLLGGLALGAGGLTLVVLSSDGRERQATTLRLSARSLELSAHF